VSEPPATPLPVIDAATGDDTGAASDIGNADVNAAAELPGNPMSRVRLILLAMIVVSGLVLVVGVVALLRQGRAVR
jgi:hypothetical protein